MLRAAPRGPLAAAPSVLAVRDGPLGRTSLAAVARARRGAAARGGGAGHGSRARLAGARSAAAGAALAAAAAAAAPSAGPRAAGAARRARGAPAAISGSALASAASLPRRRAVAARGAPAACAQRGAAGGGQRPRCVVFDLDGCLWHPDMYMLWGGGSPFEEQPDGTLRDCRGQTVALHAGVRSALNELVDGPDWQGVTVAAASCCDEPAWARECMAKFSLGSGRRLEDVLTIAEIYKGSKQGHLRTIARKVGCELEDMIFFDNEPYNCDNVCQLGVTCIFCPGGVTDKVWRTALESFPSPGEVIRA